MKKKPGIAKSARGTNMKFMSIPNDWDKIPIRMMLKNEIKRAAIQKYRESNRSNRLTFNQVAMLPENLTLFIKMTGGEYTMIPYCWGKREGIEKNE
ncbi:hypothetical protein HYU14_07090 [Candidatus Woesearchaeota archaeon]|nr:hypothetical protein [Candidatus Woesearchaeota archaeon]